jgi:hypothetical protein
MMDFVLNSDLSYSNEKLVDDYCMMKVLSFFDLDTSIVVDLRNENVAEEYCQNYCDTSFQALIVVEENP